MGVLGHISYVVPFCAAKFPAFSFGVLTGRSVNRRTGADGSSFQDRRK
jgi:hypothetical protein